MKKFFTKLLLVLFPLVISIILTIVIFGLLGNVLNDQSFLNPYNYMNNVFLYNLIFIFLPILFALSILSFTFILVRKLTIKYPKFVITLTLLVFIGINFLFKPFKVTGGDAGPYKNGETVLSISKEIFTEVDSGDVIVFKREVDTESVAQIVGLPGSEVDEAYFFNNTKLEESTVPVGYYSAKFGEGRYLWLIPEKDIKYIVWFSFK